MIQREKGPCSQPATRGENVTNLNFSWPAEFSIFYHHSPCIVSLVSPHLAYASAVKMKAALFPETL
jgi:hypothetical protein